MLLLSQMAMAQVLLTRVSSGVRSAAEATPRISQSSGPALNSASSLPKPAGQTMGVSDMPGVPKGRATGDLFPTRTQSSAWDQSRFETTNLLQELMASELVVHSKLPSGTAAPARSTSGRPVADQQFQLVWNGLRVRVGIASGVEASDVVLNRQRCAATCILSCCGIPCVDHATTA
jgi:hypothetical protein